MGLSFRQVAWLFLKCGAQSFGGWSTTVVLLEHALKKSAVSVDLKTAVASAQLLPGATQVLIVANVGHQLAGRRGAGLATICYITPAVVLMTAFAAVYFADFNSGNVSEHLTGLTAALSGLILANAYKLGQRHVRHWTWWLVAIAAGAAYAILNIPVLAIIIIFGLTVLGVSFIQKNRRLSDD